MNVTYKANVPIGVRDFVSMGSLSLRLCEMDHAVCDLSWYYNDHH